MLLSPRLSSSPRRLLSGKVPRLIYLIHPRQILRRVDADKMMKNGDFKEINEWLRSRIWRFGCLCKPGELLEQALGKPFDPSHYISYLTHKYGELYGLSL